MSNTNLKTPSNIQPPWSDQAIKDIWGMMNKGRSAQNAAAALAASTVIIAETAGNVNDLYVVLNAALAAGESLVVDVVKISAGGGAAATILSGTRTLTSADPANTKISLKSLLLSTKIAYLPGEVFQVVRTYTAGGGPAAPANTVVVEL